MVRGALIAALVLVAGGAWAQDPPAGFKVRIGASTPPLPDEDGIAEDDATDEAEDEAAGASGREGDAVEEPGAAPMVEIGTPTRVEEAAPARRKRKARRRRPRRERWKREPAVTPLQAALALGETPGDVIEFARTISFRHDSVKTTAEAREALTEVVDYLQASPEIRLVLIEGHTDATGSMRYNQALSEARAVAVRQALVAAGVSPDRLVAYGYGETRPATPERADNRRVVFRIIEGDRKVLTRRVATEWGQAAVVDVRGVVEAAPSPETEGGPVVPEPEAAPSPGTKATAGRAPGAASTPRPAGAMALVIAPPTAGPTPAALDGPAWRPVPARTQLGEGYDVRTAAASHAWLRLPDLGRIWLGPDTRIRLSKLHHDRGDGKTYLALRVRHGTVVAMLNPLERRISRSLIALPGGGLEVVAADFELRVEPDGSGRLRVDRGRIDSTGGARQASVFAGQTARLGADAARAQLPPPTAESPLDGRFQRPPPLIWRPVPGAVAYRVEVAADVDFGQPLVRARTTAPRFELPALPPDGAWFWRVRAIDSDGLTGSASRIHRFRTAPPVEGPPAAARLEPARR